MSFWKYCWGTVNQELLRYFNWTCWLCLLLLQFLYSLRMQLKTFGTILFSKSTSRGSYKHILLSTALRPIWLLCSFKSWKPYFLFSTQIRGKCTYFKKTITFLKITFCSAGLLSALLYVLWIWKRHNVWKPLSLFTSGCFCLITSSAWTEVNVVKGPIPVFFFHV